MDGAEGVDTASDESRLLRKCETILRRRTSQITIVVERSVDSHNYSAIIRTAEAFGVQHLWVISPPSLDTNIFSKKGRKKNDVWEVDAEERLEHIAFAKQAGKWTTIRTFASTAECMAALKAAGKELWVTDLSQVAEDLEDVLGPTCPGPAPLPRAVAIAFGSEGSGASPELLAGARRRVYLRMHGFADSLNLSVSAALVLQRMMLADPGCVGNMGHEERCRLRAEWYPRMARSPEDARRFASIAARENRSGPGGGKVAPFTDLRRPEQHRYTMKPYGSST